MAIEVQSPSATMQSLGWMIIAFLILPITVVFAVSLTDRSYLSLPEHGLSFQYYRKLFSSPEWLSSIWQSLVIATASTAVAVVLGTLAAIGCWRLGGTLAAISRLVLIAPLMLPPIVYALGAYQVWIQLGWVNTYVGLIVAHAMTGLPYVVITVSSALAGVDARLEQAARSLGANTWQSLRHVIIPNILPGVFSGVAFAFVHSWDELVIALFLAGRAVFTLPRRMWDGINEQLDPTMAAVASLLSLLTLAIIIAEIMLRSRRR